MFSLIKLLEIKIKKKIKKLVIIKVILLNKLLMKINNK